MSSDRKLHTVLTNDTADASSRPGLDRRGLAAYLIGTFALSWLIMAVMYVTRDPARTRPHPFGTMLAMWMPGITAVVVSKLISREPLALTGLGRLRLGRYHLWAYVLPVLFATASVLLTPLLGTGTLDLSLTPVREAMAGVGGQTGSADMPSLVTVVVAQAFFALVIAPMVAMFVAMGEELGWRGYLLRKLLPLGQWPALLITGAVWGIWHIPLVMMGLNYPGRPVTGPLLMIGFCLLIGIVLGWLQLRSGTVWVAALAHGTFNAVNGLPLLLLANVDRALGGPPSSLTGWIGIAACIVWLVATRRLPVRGLSTPATSLDLATSTTLKT